MNGLRISASSRTGCIRGNNEDMILIADRFIRDDSLREQIAISDESRFVLALADGMGGCNAGEVASAETLANLEFFVRDLPEGLTPVEFENLIREWLKSINQIIASKGYVNPKLSNMGTTLVAVVYYGSRFFWMNCGDSRLYRMRDGKLSQLTTDHSLDKLTGQGCHSNIITNCIGAGCTTSYIDICDFTNDVKENDIYMLCSDGLNDMISEDEIAAILSDGGNADELCQYAIDAGGFDNVSVCVIMIVG